jgi:hypothetical protein
MIYVLSRALNLKDFEWYTIHNSIMINRKMFKTQALFSLKEELNISANYKI